MWAHEGWDPDRIRDNAAPEDIRYCKMGGDVYRVRIMVDREGQTHKKRLSSIQTISGAQRTESDADRVIRLQAELTATRDQQRAIASDKKKLAKSLKDAGDIAAKAKLSIATGGDRIPANVSQTAHGLFEKYEELKNGDNQKEPIRVRLMENTTRRR